MDADNAPKVPRRPLACGCDQQDRYEVRQRRLGEVGYYQAALLRQQRAVGQIVVVVLCVALALKFFNVI